MAVATQSAPGASATRNRTTGNRWRHANYAGGLAGWVWLLIIIVPIYYIVVTSLKLQSDYFGANPLALPASPTMQNYSDVLAAGFPRFFLNSLLVTVGAVVPMVIVSFMAAYAIIRNQNGFLKFTNGVFIMGLTIPLQATIIPLYWMITRSNMYDTLAAIIIPSIAFGIPLTVLILSNFLRDVPRELFESMRVDGATEWQMMIQLALPLTRPAITTVTIYNALNVWNGFLLPLILTQSPDLRVLPLALWSFQSQYSVNIPAVLASVVLTTLPIVVLYVLGRRQLISGLTAGFSK
ncbi:carbohydrate ABC transporter permease [Micrococcales bacterium 31B]|nr:carbohydrate ABC transporter permease [Micrococcales bacterium 31B]